MSTKVDDVNPTKVHEQMGHPVHVDMRERAGAALSKP